MRRENQSRMSEFLLLGLPIQPEHQGMFFALFLGMYLTTVLGNLLIILLIRLNPRLHTPMYFFLSHLALTDISFSSVTVPKMLMYMHTHDQSIPYAGCISQMYFFLLFGCLDNFLLAVMAYDRYVAICQPLHYTTVMRQELCVSLVAGSWVLCSILALLHTLLLVQLSSDTSINDSILGSYVHIGTAVLSVSFTKNLFKVFSTCGSHLFVVSLYYGTIASVYFFSSSWESNDKDNFLKLSCGWQLCNFKLICIQSSYMVLICQ
uniref:Olfactory receptor n=1 Tax=Sus scrofa TaxID=9823 RepID=A0A4X1SDE0_PIG